MVWALLLITATTNAVNLTDGLDGLAAGAGAFGFAAFTVIGFWQFRHADFYDNPHALDLAVVAAAMVGGIIGFLWWNARPPRFSWVTQGRSRSEVASPRSPSRPVRISCCRSSVVSS